MSIRSVEGSIRGCAWTGLAGRAVGSGADAGTTVGSAVEARRAALGPGPPMLSSRALALGLAGSTPEPAGGATRLPVPEGGRRACGGGAVSTDMSCSVASAVPGSAVRGPKGVRGGSSGRLPPPGTARRCKYDWPGIFTRPRPGAPIRHSSRVARSVGSRSRAPTSDSAAPARRYRRRRTGRGRASPAGRSGGGRNTRSP
jgi:hypothetical protein